ncbi:MAG TPA: hypothetical protein VM143_09995 [Acidimicrobiales bacterium]|nr:hypothetical protein [Acidimicrobiales bacterium]
MRRRADLLAAVVLALALASTAAGCGSGSDAAVVSKRVPDDLVPDQYTDEGLLVLENTDESTVDALANAKDTTLAADTRVWEIRRGQRLVATLQVSSVLPKVHLLEEDVRDRFVAQVIPGQVSRIRTGDVEVFTTSVDDKTTYLWFGSELFEILQTKDRELQPEKLLAAVVAYQDDKKGWVPLPLLVELE